MAVKTKDSKRKDGASSVSLGSETNSSSVNTINKELQDLQTAYRNTYRELLAYARIRVDSKEMAQDIVHQAFANTLSSIEHGVRIRNMSGFLQRCVCNLCISHMRREHPKSDYDDLYQPIMTERSAESVAAERAQWQQVSTAVGGLAPHQRYAFLASELQGIEHEEIGRRMGRSTKSVTQLVYRARRQVRERVAPGRVAGWWWPFGKLRQKRYRERSEKHSGSFSLAGAQLATLSSWLARVFHASANTLLQQQTPVAAAAVVFVLAGVAIAPQASDNAPPAGVPGTGQTGHEASASKKYLAGFPTLKADPATAAPARDSAGSLYIESSGGPYVSSEAPPSTTGQESRDSATAKSGHTGTISLNVVLTEPVLNPTEPPATGPDPQTPVPAQTTPPTVPGDGTECGTATDGTSGCDSTGPPDTDGDGISDGDNTAHLDTDGDGVPD